MVAPKIDQTKVEEIYKYVHQDLHPSVWSVTWRLGLSIFLGGFLSMIFCGQFGLGLSRMAQDTMHMVHSRYGSIRCSILCGMIFTLAPIVILKGICSRFLFRHVIWSYHFILFIFLNFFAFLIYMNGSVMNDVPHVFMWSLSAYISFKSWGVLLDEAVKARFKFL
ncbi:MAG: hypothetical protein AB8C84_06505 [Oligoflexales bacterium]